MTEAVKPGQNLSGHQAPINLLLHLRLHTRLLGFMLVFVCPFLNGLLLRLSLVQLLPELGNLLLQAEDTVGCILSLLLTHPKPFHITPQLLCLRTVCDLQVAQLLQQRFVLFVLCKTQHIAVVGEFLVEGSLLVPYRIYSDTGAKEHLPDFQDVSVWFCRIA